MRGVPGPALVHAEELRREVHRVLTAVPGSLELLADELCQPYQTTRSQLLDNATIPLDTVRAAIFVAARQGGPVHALYRLWLWPGMRAGLAPDGLAPSEDWEHEAGDVAIAAARLLEQVRSAVSDGRITPDEDQRLRRSIASARRELAEIEELLNRAEARGGEVSSRRGPRD